ncbi:MAG: HEAT repeat domain-containing protein [Pseudomonadota bacterium]
MAEFSCNIRNSTAADAVTPSTKAQTIPVIIKSSGVQNSRCEGRAKSYSQNITSHNPSSRLDAIYNLGTLGKGAKCAIPSLKMIMLKGSWDERRAAVKAFAKIGVAAIPELLNILCNHSRIMRKLSIDAIGLIGTNAQSNTPHLIALLKKEPSSTVQLALVNTLINLNIQQSYNARRSLAVVLYQHTKDKNETVKLKLAATLPTIKEASIETLKKILLNDKSKWVRFYALTSLRKMQKRYSFDMKEILVVALQKEKTTLRSLMRRMINKL